MRKTGLFLGAVLFLVGSVVGVSNSAAAAYPERAIEIIVPFGVGGGSDTAARAVAEGLKPLLKVPLVITNMPGGGATKGMLYVSQQPADGYDGPGRYHLPSDRRGQTEDARPHPEGFRSPHADPVGYVGGDHRR